jgi:hypothetical protein
MDVIRHAIDAIQTTSFILTEAIDIGIKIPLVSLADDRLTCLRTYDKMIQGI